MPLEGDNMMSVKRTNRSAALRLLHEQGGMSRKKLSESIKLTPAAITKIVGEMMSEGLIAEGRALPSGGAAGRREVLVELNPRSRCALGIMINLKKAVLSAVWLDGSLIFSQELAIPERAQADATLETLCQRLLELAGEASLDRAAILGVGVAIRGLTDMEGRVVRNSLGALDRQDYPITERVEALTGLSAVMANNVRALFVAQMFLSRDEGIRSQFFLRCEYGIGASLSINNELWQGGSGQCAEIGHIPVVRRGGKPCMCGKSGCLETIASPTAIREDALAIMSPERTPVLWNMAKGLDAADIDIGLILDAARNGDDGTAELVDRAVRALGSALKGVIYTLDPEKLVLYGRMFENSFYLSRLLADMNEGVGVEHKGVVIEKSPYNLLLDDKAAGILMVEKFFRDGGMR